MPKEKRSSIDKTSGDEMSTPATPRPRRNGADSPSLLTLASKKSQDETPTLKRSTSATSSSAAKVVSKVGSMAPPPPRTPSRTSAKTRPSEEATVPTATHSPTSRSKAEMEEADKMLEKDLLDMLDGSTTPPAVATPPPPPQVQTVFDAGAPIDDFDWKDLEQRYITQTEALDAKERAVYEDLARLNLAWAEAGQNKESDRASKRLRTRIAYVQNEEQRVREKREHYLHVVNAFRSALNLLDRN